jgi:hypothetical protein
MNPTVIWATAGPVSSFIVARKASRHTGIPYVLDFRDSWTITYNEFEERRPTWGKRLAEKSMHRLLEGAQSIVFRFHREAECFWRAYNGAMKSSSVYIIPNGYEGGIERFTAPRADRCEILYTGTLSDYRYDTLLQALSSLKQEASRIADHLHFTFVGEGTDILRDAAASLRLSDMITTREPVPHQEIHELSTRAHAVLILGRPAGMRGYELFAGAKLFGYLKLGMPIIGVLPADETRNILRRVGLSNSIADINSIGDIKRVLAAAVDAWKGARLTEFVPDPTVAQFYSSEHQTEELVRALEAVPAADPFVPGSTEIPASLRLEISNRSNRPSHCRAAPEDVARLA